MKNDTYITHGQSNRLAVSIRELAAATGVCQRKIYQEISSGRLSITRIGRRVLIRMEEVDRWLRSAESSTKVE